VEEPWKSLHNEEYGRPRKGAGRRALSGLERILYHRRVRAFSYAPRQATKAPRPRSRERGWGPSYRLAETTEKLRLRLFPPCSIGMIEDASQVKGRISLLGDRGPHEFPDTLRAGDEESSGDGVDGGLCSWLGPR